MESSPDKFAISLLSMFHVQSASNFDSTDIEASIITKQLTLVYIASYHSVLVTAVMLLINILMFIKQMHTGFPGIAIS